MFECDRIHYYKLSLAEFRKFMSKDGFSLTLIDSRVLELREDEPDQKDVISVVSLNTKTEQGYTVAFDTMGYILNEKGRTVERLWTEPASIHGRERKGIYQDRAAEGIDPQEFTDASVNRK